MKIIALSLALSALPASGATAQDMLAPLDQAANARPRPELLMTNPTITRAVRDTLADSKPAPLKDGAGRTLHGDAQDKFTRQVDEAQVPSCWRPDAMKHAPPRIGPLNLGGLLALPFWGWAIVSGKCNQ